MDWQLDPTLEAYNRLLEQHCTPAKKSIAYLATLHSVAAGARDNPTMINGESCYPMAIQMLDEMISAAQRENDDAFFRRYAQAIEMASSRKPRHQSLTEQIVVAWYDLLEEHGRSPSRTDVKKKLGLTRGQVRWRYYEPRSVRRAFQAASELFDPAE